MEEFGVCLKNTERNIALETYFRKDRKAKDGSNPKHVNEPVG